MSDTLNKITEDNTIRALKLLRREMQSTPPNERNEFLSDLTAVCIMATQGHLGEGFANGLMDMARLTPCPFVIDLDGADEDNNTLDPLHQ